MPELPEVESVRRGLAPWLTGRRIVRAARQDAPAGPKYLHLEQASGQRVTAVRRRGKYLVMPLDRGDELVVHLGMTGQVLKEAPSDHVRVVLELDRGPHPVLYFRDVRRFGRFLLCIGGDRSGIPTLSRMGPEPLEAAFTVDRLRDGLASRAGIKSWLLSQRPVAGLGNIYVDEALFAAQIHPLTPSERISAAKVRALHGAIVRILGAAVARGGTTLRDYRNVAGESGGFQSELLAYGRGGEPCRRCGTSLTKSLVQQRTTVHCPRCQRRSR